MIRTLKKLRFLSLALHLNTLVCEAPTIMIKRKLLVLAIAIAPCFASSSHAQDFFRRGDVNNDGIMNIADSVAILGTLFLGDDSPACENAFDVNDDDIVNIADALFGLNFLFLGGAAPPAPGTDRCGPDATPGRLTCESYSGPSCSSGPSVIIVSPASGETIESSSVVVAVEAAVPNGSSIERLTIDGVSVPAIRSASMRVALTPGHNLLRAQVVDGCGRTDFAEVAVIYRPPHLPAGPRSRAFVVAVSNRGLDKVEELLDPFLAALVQNVEDLASDWLNELRLVDIAALNLEVIGDRVTVSDVSLDVIPGESGLVLKVRIGELRGRALGTRSAVIPDNRDFIVDFIVRQVELDGVLDFGCSDGVVRLQPRSVEIQIQEELDIDVTGTTLDVLTPIVEIFPVDLYRDAIQTAASSALSQWAEDLDSFGLQIPDISVGPLRLSSFCHDVREGSFGLSYLLEAEWGRGESNPVFPEYGGSVLRDAPFPSAPPTPSSSSADVTVCVSLDTIQQALFELTAAGTLSDFTGTFTTPLTMSDLGMTPEALQCVPELTADAPLTARLEAKMAPTLRFLVGGGDAANLPVELDIRELVVVLSAGTTDVFAVSLSFRLEALLELDAEALRLTMNLSDDPQEDGVFPRAIVGGANGLSIRVVRESVDVDDAQVVTSIRDTLQALLASPIGALLTRFGSLRVPLPAPDFFADTGLPGNKVLELQSAKLVGLDTDGDEVPDWACVESSFELRDPIIGSGTLVYLERRFLPDCWLFQRDDGSTFLLRRGLEGFSEGDVVSVRGGFEPCFVPNPLCCPETNTGLAVTNPILTLRPVGGDRPALVHLPEGYTPSRSWPVILALHGYTSNMEELESVAQITGLADEYGFIYVRAEGERDLTGNRYWNAAEVPLLPTLGEPPNDSIYLRSVVRDVEDRFNVDPRRVYVLGYSNGGFMAYRLACDYPDVFAGVAVIAGLAEECITTGNVHLLHIHGTADSVVPFEGGHPSGIPFLPEFLSAEESVSLWAEYNGCLPDMEIEPEKIDLHRTLPPLDREEPSAAETTVRRYSNGCNANGTAELWTVDGAGHGFDFFPVIPDEPPPLVEAAVNWLLGHPKN